VLTLQTRLHPNEADLAVKVFDDEAIIINLANGIYYSMDNVGGFIWGLIAQRRSVGEIVAAVAAQYDVAEARAQSDLQRLAAQLVQERLVLSADDGPPADHPPARGDSRLPYATPTLEIYRDIGHLFALDPPMPGLRDVAWDASGDTPPGPRP
jgi:hypothetical protein